MPINLGTITQFFGRAMSPDEAKKIVRGASQNPGSDHAPKNFEEKAISLIGKPLYEAFIRGYTLKQWATDPRDLPSEIITRLPVRFDLNSRYFSDTWEGLPRNGYGAWFEKMLDTPRIQVFLETDFFDLKKHIRTDRPVVYTGPLDRYFDFSEGELTWRTLDFEFKTLDLEDYQGTSVMNYADEKVPFTRIHEFKHLHPERTYGLSKTVIAHEYSRIASRVDDPYYPVNSATDREVLRKYRLLASREGDVFFGGRLGSYQYLDMHMAIASALTLWENQVLPKLSP
jgi:UDP-galactopyranose mutase